MPVAPTYPGVYVEEIPSSVHTITGVSTAVTAFLGYFSQGPMNQAQQCFSIADVERTFGSLIPNSEAGYGLGQFFANGGAEAFVVRVAAAGASATAPAAASYTLQDTAGHDVLKVSAASPGQWGNSIRLAVDYNTSNPGNSFNLTVTQVDTSNPPVTTTTEVWRNLTLTASDPNFAVAVVNAGSALVNLSVPTGASTDLPAPNGTMSGDISGVTQATLGTLNTEDLMVAFGPSASPTSLTTSPGVELSRAPANFTDLAGLLQTLLQPLVPNTTVTLVNGVAPAKYLQVSAVVTANASEFVFSAALASTLKLDTTDASSTQPVQFALGATSATEGSDGAVPDATGLIGDPVLKTGLYALDGIAFNLLCLPDVMNLDDNSASAVISAAETFCAPRWAFLLVDVPQSSGGGAGQSGRDTLLGIQDWMSANATLRSTYAALYFPRPQIPDPLNGYRLRSVAPSGTMAGLYAQTDGTRGVWKAPAGTAATLVNVSALNYLVTPGGGQVIMTDAENGVLNPLGINCLRSLPVYGNVCWGARTLDGADQIASQWKYVPVRRLALYIEASLYQGTQWVVFEPNDEPLWSQIRLNVGSFMRGLFQQGAFQGSSPASAYFVRCDSTTTTQTDINNGVVNIIVGFAPLLPAEFVVLQIQQIAGQIPT